MSTPRAVKNPRNSTAWAISSGAAVRPSAGREHAARQVARWCHPIEGLDAFGAGRPRCRTVDPHAAGTEFGGPRARSAIRRPPWRRCRPRRRGDFHLDATIEVALTMLPRPRSSMPPTSWATRKIGAAHIGVEGLLERGRRLGRQ